MNTRAKVGTALRWAAPVLAALVAVPWAIAAGPRVRIEVPAPFAIGARSFPAGVIQVRPLRDFTPTTALLEVWVGGECLGMVRARIAGTEEPPRASEATFLRLPDGRLAMIGYSVASGSSGRSYRFEAPFAPSFGTARAPSGGGPATTAVALAFGTY